MSSFNDVPDFVPSLVMAAFTAGLIVLSFLAAYRIPTTRRALSSLPPMRLIVATFLFASVVCLAIFQIMLAVGTSRSHATCEAAFFTWIFAFYPSKVLLHTLLAERIHLVFFAIRPRRSSPAYYFLVAALTVANALGIYCIIARQVEVSVSPSGASECLIGIRQSVSYGILVVHVVTEVTYVLSFVWGIIKLSTGFSQGKSRRLLVRSLAASCVSLFCSFANYVHLPIVGGKEFAWIVFTVAGVDVLVNGICIFSITSPLGAHISATTTATAAIGSSTAAFRSPLDPSPHAHFAPLPIFTSPLAAPGLGLDLQTTPVNPGSRRASILSQSPRSPRAWRPRELEEDLAARGTMGNRLRGSVTTFVSLTRAERGEGVLDEEEEEKGDEEEKQEEGEREASGFEEADSVGGSSEGSETGEGLV